MKQSVIREHVRRYKHTRIYRIPPCITNDVLSFAFQAVLRTFNFAPGKISLPCGPARGCSLKLLDSILNITFSVMARRVSHRDVTSKFDPIEFSRFTSSRLRVEAALRHCSAQALAANAFQVTGSRPKTCRHDAYLRKQ